MSLYFGMAFSISFIFLEFGGVRKVTSRFLAIIPLFILFVLVAYNRMSNDYLAYQQMFIGQNDVEFGYAYLIEILKYVGRDHDTIIFIAGALLVLTLHKILKGSNNVNLVILLYCCFPLVYDINQTRNLLMYLLVVLSLSFIEKKKPYRYYISMFVAFSIHRMALVYIPFYYLCKKTRAQFIKLIWKLLIIFTIASPLIFTLLTRIFPAKLGYYSSVKPDFGVLLMVAYSALDIFTVWWVDKKIHARVDEEEGKKLEVLYRFVWFSILALPFTAYAFELKRVQRNVLLVKFIYCSLAMKHLKMRDKLITLLLLLISVIMPILVMQYTGELYIFKYLEENQVIEYLKSNLL